MGEPHDKEHNIGGPDHTGTLTDDLHGNRSGGSLHAPVSDLAGGFMTPAQKAKLDSLGPSGSIQTKFKKLEVDASTTSPTFLPLLTETITVVEGSRLALWFTVCCAGSAGKPRVGGFRVKIDGVSCGGLSVLIAFDQPATGAIVCEKPGLSAGPHVVTVEWAMSTGTLYILPVTYPDAQHAHLLLMEIY